MCQLVRARAGADADSGGVPDTRARLNQVQHRTLLHSLHGHVQAALWWPSRVVWKVVVYVLTSGPIVGMRPVLQYFTIHPGERIGRGVGGQPACCAPSYWIGGAVPSDPQVGLQRAIIFNSVCMHDPSLCLSPGARHCMCNRSLRREYVAVCHGRAQMRNLPQLQTPIAASRV